MQGKIYCLLLVVIMLCTSVAVNSAIVKRSYSDQSVRGYLTERTCWWNEVCKEEFQQLFRCKCPQWSYCSTGTILQCILFYDQYWVHLDSIEANYRY